MKTNKKGFTLIEIIVVIVILAVLLAVAVPSVLSYIHEADDAKRLTEAKAILTESQKYLVYKYADERKNSNATISNSLTEDERNQIVDNVKGKGQLKLLSYVNGEVVKMRYFIDGKYVVFKGYNDKFYIENNIVEDIPELIVNSSETFKKLNSYFKLKPDGWVDSESYKTTGEIHGVGNDIKKFLEAQGIDCNQVSWSIVRRKSGVNPNTNKNEERYEFMIYDKKISEDMLGQEITVKKYIYYESGHPDKSPNNFDVEKTAKVVRDVNANGYVVIRG
ncbi:MAG: prepilin-type N-terminal cleavage/methylation domain-containing protein [Longibaculum sp.]